MAPHRDELEMPLGQLIVARSLLTTSRTLCPSVPAGLYIHLLACLVVHPDYRGSDRGGRLLNHMEAAAKAQGIEQLFILTTQTAHWFRERGFVQAGLKDLPIRKRELYNYRRNSKVFFKRLTA